MSVDLTKLSATTRGHVRRVVEAYHDADEAYDELVRDGVLLYLGRDDDGKREVIRVVMLDESAVVREPDARDLDRGTEAGPDHEGLSVGIDIGGES